MSDWSIPKDIPSGMCLSCKQPEIKLIKLSAGRRLTQTETMICQNKKCQMYFNLAKVKNWIPLNTKGYQRDFRTQNRPEYNINRATHRNY